MVDIGNLFGDYPPPAFHFKVSFAAVYGMADTSFQEVSGISSELETEPVEAGGENRFKYQLPKLVRHSNLVLKRGIASIASPLVLWCKSVLENGLAEPIEPQGINVYLLNEMQIPIRGWSFDGAYPLKWEVEGFNSTKNEVAIEKIELSYNYFTRLI